MNCFLCSRTVWAKIVGGFKLKSSTGLSHMNTRKTDFLYLVPNIWGSSGTGTVYVVPSMQFQFCEAQMTQP